MPEDVRYVFLLSEEGKVTRRLKRLRELAAKPLLSVSDACDILDVTSSTLRKWIHSGELRAYCLPSGRFRIERSDLIAFLRPVGGSDAP